jgi:hypothetical protein
VNWTFGVTTNGMAGFFGAVYLGVVAIRTRQALFRAAHVLRRAVLTVPLRPRKPRPHSTSDMGE